MNFRKFLYDLAVQKPTRYSHAHAIWRMKREFGLICSLSNSFEFPQDVAEISFPLRWRYHTPAFSFRSKETELLQLSVRGLLVGGLRQAKKNSFFYKLSKSSGIWFVVLIKTALTCSDTAQAPPVWALSWAQGNYRRFVLWSDRTGLGSSIINCETQSNLTFAFPLDGLLGSLC